MFRAFPLSLLLDRSHRSERVANDCGCNCERFGFRSGSGKP